MSSASNTSRTTFDAVIFDLDGVLTDTAELHFAAWKEAFDPFVESSAGPAAKSGFTRDDYRRSVDGRPRYQGAERFLASRGIALPFGAPGDSPGLETICGLGNLKNAYYHRLLQTTGVPVYESTIPVLDRLTELGVATAVVTSSRNGRQVLESAGILDRFEVVVDGTDLSRLGLPGKPHPALFLEAARRLGIPPARTVVVEDATAGVQAGHDGGFGLVVGVDRNGASGELLRSGAQTVVRDLRELPFLEPVAEGGTAGSDDGERGGGDSASKMTGHEAPAEAGAGADPRPIRSLPSVTESKEEVLGALVRSSLVVFLDYDGTLTPIAERPEDARLSRDTREALLALARLCPVCIVSGRDRQEVQELVGIPALYYAGSHGFDIVGPGGLREERGEELGPTLDEAVRHLSPWAEGMAGVRLERKRYALAVHFREAGPEVEPRVRAELREVMDRVAGLKMTGGKMILELRPDLDWDKGKALARLLELVVPKGGGDAFPLYIGDDLTDEDAFQALQGHGMGIVVRGEGDERTTAAQYSLPNPGEVRSFLEDLAGALRRRET